MKHLLGIFSTSFTFLNLFFFTLSATAKTVEYELTVERKPVNLSGRTTVDFALTVNGSIPAPTLEFTEGDLARITVHNRLDEEVSIHWHGLLLPPEMDGVAYVNTPPIFAGRSHTFEFPIRQHGTYWYHSHTKVQEQKGVYGAFIIHPRKKFLDYDEDVVVVLSDWSDENADEIIKNLRKDGDYYLYKKDSMRSYFEAFSLGKLTSHLNNEWIRMGGMDLSDVGYDAFLINGKRDSQLSSAPPGTKLRIRIINAAASSYFYVALGNQPMRVVSADGSDIEPIMAKELLMGMAETYDIIFTVPPAGNYELRATCQDVTGHASGWIGSGAPVPAPDKPQPDYYAEMDHGAHGGHGADGGHDVNHGAHAGHHNHHAHHKPRVIETLAVDDLRARASTKLPEAKPQLELKLVLGGNMERYVWHINGKAIHEDRLIEINEGDNVRFVFQNETMMHHPMHLHGHFFRVLNGGGDFSPLKHTVDVPPHGSRVIEFHADEPGQWMLHCHNLYHMKTGMARIVKYRSFTPTGLMAKFDKMDPHRHDHVYTTGMLEAATNHAQAELKFLRSKDAVEFHAETRDYDSSDHIEGELLYRRWKSNFLNFAVGAVHVEEYEEDQTRAVAGIGYVLPLLIEVGVLLDHTGKVSLELEKRFQWTKTILSDLDVSVRPNMDTEFELTLMYSNVWEWAAGFMFTEDKSGFGFHYKF